MKGILAIAIVLVATSAAFAQSGHYSGFDSNGNYYWGNTTSNGYGGTSWSGFDGNGDYYHGNMQQNRYGGSYSGFNGSGRYYYGSFTQQPAFPRYRYRYRW